MSLSSLEYMGAKMRIFNRFFSSTSDMNCHTSSRNLQYLCPSLVLLLAVPLVVTGCFASFEAGVVQPLSGPIQTKPTTSLGFNAGFAFDLGVGLIAMGNGVTVQKFTNEKGETVEVASLGPMLRVDGTVFEQGSGERFDRLVRVTGMLRTGGCRLTYTDAEGRPENVDNACSLSESPNTKSYLASLGAAFVFRTEEGHSLSFSLSPYYMRNRTPMESQVTATGVFAKITAVWAPSAFSGLTSLLHRTEAEKKAGRDRARQNRIRGDAMDGKRCYDKKSGKTVPCP